MGIRKPPGASPLVRERAHPQALTQSVHRGSVPSTCQEMMAIAACKLQLPQKASLCQGKFILNDEFLFRFINAHNPVYMKSLRDKNHLNCSVMHDGTYGEMMHCSASMCMGSSPVKRTNVSP